MCCRLKKHTIVVSVLDAHIHYAYHQPLLQSSTFNLHYFCLTVTQNQETRVDLILSCPFLTYFIIIIHNINNGAYKTNKSRVFEWFYTEIFSMKTSFDEFFIFYLLHCEINIQNYHSSIVIGYNLVDFASTNYKKCK